MRNTTGARMKSTGIIGRMQPMIVSEPKIVSVRDDLPACDPQDAAK